MRTYGKAVLQEDGRWHISAEPHVMMRLRRFFARGAREKSVNLLIKNTDEVARDLQWFMDRFPLEVEPIEVLQQGASRFDTWQESFGPVLRGEVSPRDFAMAIELRDYQKVGAELALRSQGLLIADAVGVGKTATAIGVAVHAETRPVLVVTLTHLPTQWEREFTKFAPGLKVHVIKGGKPYDVTARKRRSRRGQAQIPLLEPSFPDILICNYHKLAGWADTLAGVVKTVCFDEVQELRHDSSNKYDAAKHIAHNAIWRLGLSATPIHNYGSEFWNVLDVLRPGSLGTKEEFLSEWCSGDYVFDAATGKIKGKNPIRDPKAFGSYSREMGLMIRRTRQDVGRELPPVIRSVSYIETTEEEIDAIVGNAVELAKVILTRNSWKETGAASLEFDWRLRQATGIAKAPQVADFVRLLVESGERVLLYGWHRAVYNIWLERLKDLSPSLYTGTESPTQKQRSFDDFVSGKSRVLIMSLRAGAGLDGLQGHSHVVVFGELDWSPAVHEQCIGRLARDGMIEGVLAYFLVSEAGSDPAVMDALGIKTSQIHGVLDPTDEKLFESRKPGLIRALAEKFLRDRGIEIPVAEDPEEATEANPAEGAVA